MMTGLDGMERLEQQMAQFMLDRAVVVTVEIIPAQHNAEHPRTKQSEIASNNMEADKTKSINTDNRDITTYEVKPEGGSRSTDADACGDFTPSSDKHRKPEILLATLEDFSSDSVIYKKVTKRRGNIRHLFKIPDDFGGILPAYLAWRRHGISDLAGADGKYTEKVQRSIFGLFFGNHKFIGDLTFGKFLLGEIAKARHAEPHYSAPCLVSLCVHDANEALLFPGAQHILMPWLVMRVAIGMDETRLQAAEPVIKKSFFTAVQRHMKEAVTFQVVSTGSRQSSNWFIVNRQLLYRRSDVVRLCLKPDERVLYINFAEGQESFERWIQTVIENGNQLRLLEQDSKNLVKLWGIADRLEDRELQTSIMEVLIKDNRELDVGDVLLTYKCDPHDHGLIAWLLDAVLHWPDANLRDFTGVLTDIHGLQILMHYYDIVNGITIDPPTLEDLHKYTDYTDYS